MSMTAAAAEAITHLDLDSAIKSNQLVASFEPFVSLRKLQARGVELHLTWHHPQYGRLSPGLFMPFITSEGRSRQVTGFMLREGARAAADWRRAGLDWTVSLNLPLEDLVDGTLPSTLGVLLDEFDLPPEVFIIDVSESDLLARSAQALPAITGLRALGCGVALDSAPGQAMIQDLRGLPFTEIKVSGRAIVQFVDRTHHAGTGRVAARVYNARSNGMPVTAVGVESEAMLWSVQRLDFDAAQGPYICAPTDPVSLIRWEKIWQEAADNIRARKVSTRRPLAEAETPKPAPASQPAAAPVYVAPPPEPPLPDFAGAPDAEEDQDWLETAEAEIQSETEAADTPLENILIEEERIALDVFVETTEFADGSASEELPPLASDDEPFFENSAESDVPPLVDDEPVLDTPTSDEVAPEEVEFETIALDETTVEAPVSDEPVYDRPAPPAKTPAPAATEEAPALIARKLPGISKPIVMTVQNQGTERFNFLKRLGRKS